MKLLELLKRYDCQSLISVIYDARITGRVLNSIDIEREFGTEVKRVIQTKHQEICSLTNRQMEIIRKIQKRFDSGKKPLFIKGNSAAYLCDDPSSIRRSRDIDIFFDDLLWIKSELKSLGFREADRTPAPHEDSFFELDGVQIEIHKYFPILMEVNYPQSEFSKKCQLNLPDIDIKKLTYVDLLKHSTVLTNDMVNELYIPNCAMTVFVIAAHIYKDLFWQPYKIPRLRLAELFEISDLICFKDFDFAEFDAIIQEFDARHIINYVFSLVASVVQSDIRVDFDFVKAPPIKLMNDSYSPYMLATEEYFTHLPYDTFPAIVNRLGCLRCNYNRQYQTVQSDMVYYASTSEEKCEFSFIARHTGDNVFFRIEVTHPMNDGDNFCILLDRSKFAHIWFDKYPEKIRQYGTFDYTLSISEKSYSVEISFNYQTISPFYAIVAVGNTNMDNKKVSLLPICLE